jgi:hypothetical protein
MGIETAKGGTDWLYELIRQIGERFRPLGFIGQLGFRYLSPQDASNLTGRWLIAVYLVPTELAGGRHDGASVLPGFGLDLLSLSRLFTEVTTLEWKVPRSYTDGLAGPEVWLEGVYGGIAAVQLHVYADCPTDEVPALVLDVVTNTLRVK